MTRNLRAFTLVELLVVIAIIGILVSILLPAIQASRESVRRAACTNQMRQLIVALHDFDMAHEHLPSGTVNPTGPIQNLPNGHHISWVARILPYIEENVLYDNLDLSLSAYHNKNDRVRQTTIGLLICPSSPTEEWPYSNYAGCHHDVEAPIDPNNRGVLFLNSNTSQRDLKDGAAYTIILGEKTVDNCDLGWLSGTSSTLRNTGSPPVTKGRSNDWGSAPPWYRRYQYQVGDGQWNWDAVEYDPATGEIVDEAGEEFDSNSADGESTVFNEAAESVAEGASEVDDELAAEETVAVDDGEGPNVAADPELKTDANGFYPYSRRGGNSAKPLYVGGFGSNHPGGVNFAFGDGSVRFLAEDVTAGLLGRLANREDGQIVDANEL